MQAHSADDPAARLPARPAKRQPCQPECRDEAEAKTGRHGAFVAEQLEDAEVVVLIHVPEVLELHPEQSQPSAGVLAHEGVGLGFPIGGNLRARHCAAIFFLWDEFGVAQHSLLRGAHRGRDARVAVRLGVVADVEVQPIVRGEEDVVFCHEAVVQPDGRSREIDARQ